MSRKNYPPELRRRLVELYRSGVSAERLGRDYEPSATTIRKWVAEADERESSPVSLTQTELLGRIRELERQLAVEREEKEILVKAAAWFARESVSLPTTRSDS